MQVKEGQVASQQVRRWDHQYGMPPAAFLRSRKPLALEQITPSYARNASAPKANVQRGTKSALITRHVVTVIAWWGIVSIRRLIPVAVMPIVTTHLPALMPPPTVLLASRATVVAIVAAIPIDLMHQ